MSKLIVKQFSSKKATQHFDMEAFWCHSITAATAARMLAKSLNLGDIEQYFIMGLLHDIGKMVMQMLLPVESKKLQTSLQGNPGRIFQAEQEIFGFDHAQLGAELLRAWHFPDSLIHAVSQHHRMQTDCLNNAGAAITHIANVVANNLYAPISADDDNVLDPDALTILGLTTDMLEGVYEDTYVHMDDLLQILYYSNAA